VALLECDWWALAVLKSVISNTHVVDFKDGVYGDDGQDNKSKAVIYEDDESEESDGGEDVLEGWNPNLSEKLLTNGEFKKLDLTFIDP
jgi:hypothetical protein